MPSMSLLVPKAATLWPAVPNPNLSQDLLSGQPRVCSEESNRPD